MANNNQEEEQCTVRFLLNNVRILLEDSERHEVSDNINILENISRRLEDMYDVISVLVNHCPQHVEQPLQGILDTIRTYMESYESLIEESQPITDTFQLNVQHTGLPGQPRLDLDMDLVQTLYNRHRNWLLVADLLG